jgi:hypothetical protein
MEADGGHFNRQRRLAQAERPRQGPDSAPRDGVDGRKKAGKYREGDNTGILLKN